MKSSAILKKACKLIRKNGHCKGEYARNKYRHKVDPISLSAVRFCPLGAIHKVLGIPSKAIVHENLNKYDNATMYLTVTVPWDGGYRETVDEYNDRADTTLEDVEEWFKLAIKRAKSLGN